MELYQLKNQNISFDSIVIDDSIQLKLYSFELDKSEDKYLYITINSNNYYIFYDREDDYSFLSVEQMPVNIIDFCQKNKNDDIIFLKSNNEYLMKLVYSRSVFSLINVYIIKSELKRVFDLEEGDMRMIIYSPNEKEINVEINILEDEITSNSYLNMRIPSKKINGNLYVTYNGSISILNNTGFNIYNEGKDFKFNLKISNNDNLMKEIPILIKFGYEPNKIKNISYNDNYEFNKGEFGIIKYKEDKKISLKFKTELSSLSFSYYNCYLSNDLVSNNINIINPESFKNIKLNSKEYDFEIETELDLEKKTISSRENIMFLSNENLKIEHLYLIFSFNGKAQVSTGEKPKDTNVEETDLEDDSFVGSAGFVVMIVIIILLVIAVGLFVFFRIRRKRGNSESFIGSRLVDQPNQKSGIEFQLESQ